MTALKYLVPFSFFSKTLVLFEVRSGNKTLQKILQKEREIYVFLVAVGLFLAIRT